MARPRVKMFAGAVLAVIGAWWYLPGGGLNTLLAPYSSVTNLQSLIVGLQGGSGIILIMVGVFIAWIARDQVKLQNEMKRREQQETASGAHHRINLEAESTEGEGTATMDEDDASTDEDDKKEQDAKEQDEDKQAAIEQDTGEQEDTFACDECGKEFDSERGLNIHKAQVHR